MSADVRTWLERLRGHGRSQVCTLEPKDCRELADVVAQLMADLENELSKGPTAAEWKDAALERDQLKAWQLEVAEALGFVNRAEGQDGYEVAPAKTIIEHLQRR